MRVAGGGNNDKNGGNTEVGIAILHLDYVDAYLISFHIKKYEKHGGWRQLFCFFDADDVDFMH